MNSDSWRRSFQLGKAILSIPNNMPEKIDSGGAKAFFEQKTTAMFASTNHVPNLKKHMEAGLHVGIAQYPSYKDQPNVYGLVDAHYMLITKQSKHKDAAAKVLKTLTSDEVQLAAASRFGRLSPLKNPDIKQKLGTKCRICRT